MVLLVGSTNLMAFSAYINVIDVQTKKELSYPYSKLKSMGYKMLYSKKGSSYLVYVGPFKSEKSLQYHFRKIKNRFSTAQIVTKGSKTESSKSQEKQKSQLSYEDGFCLGFGAGYGSASSTNNATSSLTLNEVKESGINYALYSGYNFENGVSILLNYMYLNTEDLEFSNIYTSLNYNVKLFDSFVPYVGLSLGYSSLHWNVNPVDQLSSSSSNDSADLMYAAQVGFNYLLTKHISLKFDYSYLVLKQATYITQDTGETFKLEYKSLHSFITALQYNF